MTASPSVPAALEVGWLNLDGIEGCSVLDEPRWLAREARWFFPVELACEAPSSLVPSRTRWFVVVGADYPDGSVEVYPAVAGGPRVTFPHQSHNGQPEQGGLWRAGNICLTVPWTEGKRRDRASPPGTPDRRLRWTLERAHDWLDRAATGRLVAPGDPYELPDFDAGTTDELGIIVVPGLVNTNEWLQRSRTAWGIAPCRTLRPAGGASRITVIRELCPDQLGGSGPLHTPWGTLLSETPGTDHHGAWLWLPAPPRLPPWQAPQTWGELRGWAQGAGIDLEPPLAEICARFRTRAGAMVLVGFPIPGCFAGPFETVAWQALHLPPLRTRARLPARLHARALPEVDRAGPLADTQHLQWLTTSIWSRDRLAVRGVADPTLQSLRVTILGVGAVGARLAELLVRVGVRRLHLIDGDTIEAGNLVRHITTLHALGVFKATALRPWPRRPRTQPYSSATPNLSSMPRRPTRYFELWRRSRGPAPTVGESFAESPRRAPILLPGARPTLPTRGLRTGLRSVAQRRRPSSSRRAPVGRPGLLEPGVSGSRRRHCRPCRCRRPRARVHRAPPTGHPDAPRLRTPLRQRRKVDRVTPSRAS